MRRHAILAALSAACLATASPSPALAGGDASANAPTERPLHAAFLVVDGVYDSELMAPYDVFHHTVFHTDPAPGIEVFTVSPDGQMVTTFEGIRLLPEHSFETAPPIDVLVVPSAEGSMGGDLEDRRMIDWVRETAASARYVVSLCDGAFVLAQAGLLDGHSATTFPGDYDAFASRFPEVDLRINVSFVHDGKLLTSQGGAKSYDVAMYLVDLLYGESVAQGVGAGLLLPWPLQPQAMPTVVTLPRAWHRHPGTAEAETAEP
jgi:transcriptional regulator GlxA family with amidase domain